MRACAFCSGYPSFHQNRLSAYMPTAGAGGSAGIGKATAFAFDLSGAHVAVLGRRLERLDAVVIHLIPLAI
jgi:hypothetical protein